jgi:hypothetical protein
MEKLTLAKTVAYRISTPEEKQKVFEVLKKYDYKVSSDPDMIAQKLNAIILNNGEEGLLDVLSVHPDRDEILEAGMQKHHNSDGGYHNCCGSMRHADGGSMNGAPSRMMNQHYHNCEGCGGTCGGKKRNADGDNAPVPVIQQPTVQQMSKDHFPAVLVLGIVAIFGLYAMSQKH